MSRCHSCLKETEFAFCKTCAKKLFGHSNFSATLNFDIPELAFPKQDEKRRISISGAQTKFSVKIENGAVTPTERGGTFIMKPALHPEFTLYQDMPANEHATMQMAKQIFKIPTAESALMNFKNGEPVYLTKRFDVIESGPHAGEHVNQSDFAQIAGLVPEEAGSDYKYTKLSYEEIASLMKEHVSAYAVAAETFFKTVLFNYLVCNGDAHIKNFSLRDSAENPGVFELAPAYDLLNTSLHIPHEPARTALDLFKDEGDFETEFFKANGFYGAPDFMEFAKRIGIVEKRAARFIEFAKSALPTMEEFIDKSFLSDEAKQRYKENLRDRAKALGM